MGAQPQNCLLPSGLGGTAASLSFGAGKHLVLGLAGRENRPRSAVLESEGAGWQRHPEEEGLHLTGLQGGP